MKIFRKITSIMASLPLVFSQASAMESAPKKSATSGNTYYIYLTDKPTTCSKCKQECPSYLYAPKFYDCSKNKPHPGYFVGAVKNKPDDPLKCPTCIREELKVATADVLEKFSDAELLSGDSKNVAWKVWERLGKPVWLFCDKSCIKKYNPDAPCTICLKKGVAGTTENNGIEVSCSECGRGCCSNCYKIMVGGFVDRLSESSKSISLRDLDVTSYMHRIYQYGEGIVTVALNCNSTPIYKGPDSDCNAPLIYEGPFCDSRGCYTLLNVLPHGEFKKNLSDHKQVANFENVVKWIRKNKKKYDTNKHIAELKRVGKEKEAKRFYFSKSTDDMTEDLTKIVKYGAVIACPFCSVSSKNGVITRNGAKRLDKLLGLISFTPWHDIHNYVLAKRTEINHFRQLLHNYVLAKRTEINHFRQLQRHRSHSSL